MMKIITWNIRGFNGRSKQRTLRDSIRAENLDILLLQETKCVGEVIEDIFQRCWKNCKSIHTYSNGVVGGLTILWNPATVIIDQPFSIVGTLIVHFRALGSNKDEMITNAYGKQSAQDKDMFLHKISIVSSLLGSTHWIIVGNFNIILALEEKIGGTKQIDQDNYKFRTLIDQLKLIDIETRNGFFTWSNQRSGNQHVARRLDHILISESIMLDDPVLEANIPQKLVQIIGQSLSG
jgi:exonuclease III